ncbi:MAG: histidine--tRNA ligase [Nanoarchaeota archaeon]
MVFFEPETVKGFPELLPPESQKFEKIKKTIKQTYENYGFIPIKTPSVEFDELMRSESIGDEDEAISDRFRLQDKGGRNLGLRYEFTFQLARIFKQHPTLKLPFRRYQIGSVFRDEPTGPGKYREFTQADADIIGDSSIEADAECLAMAKDLLDKLSIESTIIANNRKLMNALLESVQIQNKNAVFRELDKIDKLGEDMVKANLKKHADSGQILTLFKLLEKDLNFFVKNLFEGADELFKLQQLGKSYGFEIKFNPFMVRGLSYYTGNIFELKAQGKHSIGGGGRYDKVVGKFTGKQIPAVGISFGIERLMEYADIEQDQTKVIVISIDQERESIRIGQKLRRENISTIVTKEKIGKALEYADSYGIENAIFIGHDEIKKKKLKLRNMKTGKEEYLTEKQIMTKLAK